MNTLHSTSIDSGVILEDAKDLTSTNEFQKSTNDVSDFKAKEISPGNSICSQNISIVTIDENADDSSIADSDSDFEDIQDSDKKTENILAETSKGATNGIILVNNGSNRGDSSDFISTSSNVKPNIGSIAVQNSSDITFGNKTFYQGPVTIKQFLYENNKWTPSDQANSNDGNDNLNANNKNDGNYNYIF